MLGEIFVKGKGEVDYKSFLDRMQQIRREKHISRSAHFQGIQNTMFMNDVYAGRD